MAIRDRLGEREPSDQEMSRLREIICHLLSQTDYLSEERIHNIMYLIELRFLEKGISTKADFRPFIDGVYSEDIEEALSNISSLNEETVRIGNEKIRKFSGGEESTHLNSVEQEIIEDVCAKYCSIDSIDLLQSIRQTNPFQKTKFGDKMDLNRVEEGETNSDTSSGYTGFFN